MNDILDLMEKGKLVSLLLRLGLAFAFLYAAVFSTLHPEDWIGYFPQFLRQIFPQKLLLEMFSAYELLLTIWLVVNKGTFFAALLSAATLAGFMVFNFAQMDIVFRDVSLIFAALALAVLSRKSL